MFQGLVIVAGALLAMYLRSLTPLERVEFLHRVLAAVQRVRRAATQPPSGCEAFVETLRQRTRRVVVTPLVIGLTVAVFVAMCFGTGALDDPAALMRWGGSFGPRTTNAEWWRLVTAMFVHSGLLHLATDIAGLVWIGFMLERLVGPVACAVTYVAAGALAGLADLAAHQAAVNVGASGGIFGLYGLFVVSMIWAARPRSTVRIPIAALKALAPGAAVFLLYDLIVHGLHSEAWFAGFVAGLASGVLLVVRFSEQKPPMRRVATIAISTMLIVVIGGVPLAGLADVRAEIEQVVVVEHRTARDYDAALARFRDGRGTIKERIDIIDRIRPELQTLRGQLESIGKVPREQQVLLANALEYLKERDESWRLRAEALRKGNVRMLRSADVMERAALTAFRRIGSPGA